MRHLTDLKLDQIKLTPEVTRMIGYGVAATAVGFAVKSLWPARNRSLLMSGIRGLFIKKAVEVGAEKLARHKSKNGHNRKRAHA